MRGNAGLPCRSSPRGAASTALEWSYDGDPVPEREAKMKRLLIVEDQEDVRELIKITLEDDDFEIHEADNGDDGLQLAQKLRPALMLLDVMMPGSIDGLQVCQRIRADPRLAGIKIVMLTARSQTRDRKAALDAGANAYLSKPFSPLELAKMVESLAR